VDKLEKVSDEDKEESKNDNINNDETIKPEDSVNNSETKPQDDVKNNEIKPENNTSNPQTGDNIILFVSILAISILGIITTLKIRKNYAK